MIELRNVRRLFTRADGSIVAALDSINLSVDEGEFVCIIGPSGHGKSTLVQILAGLLPVTTGAVLVGGAPVTGPGPERGVVFQGDAVFPWMRVLQNVEFGLKCRGVAKAQRRQIARHYLAAVGLSHVERSWPRELSGGMLKRVAVAAVFANGAQVLLLDEPFGPLDYVTRHQLQDVLLELWIETERQTGKRRTLIFITHDVDEALTLADRVVVLTYGNIAEDLHISLPRPRSADDLATPEALRARHILLGHLGLEQLRGDRARGSQVLELREGDS